MTRILVSMLGHGLWDFRFGVATLGFSWIRRPERPPGKQAGERAALGPVSYENLTVVSRWLALGGMTTARF